LEVAVPEPEGGQEAILRLQRAFTYRYRAWFFYLTLMKQRLQEQSGIKTLAPRFSVRKEESSRPPPRRSSQNAAQRNFRERRQETVRKGVRVTLRACSWPVYRGRNGPDRLVWVPCGPAFRVPPGLFGQFQCEFRRIPLPRNRMNKPMGSASHQESSTVHRSLL
jgi:hypothetical protein